MIDKSLWSLVIALLLFYLCACLPASLLICVCLIHACMHTCCVLYIHESYALWTRKLIENIYVSYSLSLCVYKTQKITIFRDIKMGKKNSLYSCPTCLNLNWENERPRCMHSWELCFFTQAGKKKPQKDCLIFVFFAITRKGEVLKKPKKNSFKVFHATSLKDM